jgi:hypothetical protein
MNPILHPDLVTKLKELDHEWNKDLLDPPWKQGAPVDRLKQTLWNCVPTMAKLLEDKGLLATFAQDLDLKMDLEIRRLRTMKDRPYGEMKSEVQMSMIPTTPQEEHAWLLTNCVEGTVPTEYELPEDEELTEDEIEAYQLLERFGL